MILCVVFILLFNCQVNQQMRPAFFVFDLVGRNAGLEVKWNA